MTLKVDSFIFHAVGTDLRTTAKRYTNKFDTSKDGLTLLFAHGVGSHKEQWEPTIKKIFFLQQGKDIQNRIREAWTFDWQSHGDAAVLNETVLKTRKSVVSVVEYAMALESFADSHLNGHRIVALGHSAGTAAIVLSMKNAPIHRPPYISAFLIEPSILSRELFNAHAKEREDAANLTMRLTLARQDSWPNKASAAAYLRRRLPWKTWDARVFELYINHGLQDIATSGTVLKTSKWQEALSYPQFAPYIESFRLFRERCTVIPFHIICGEKVDFIPRYFRKGLFDPSDRYNPSSLTLVPRAGHLIVQENPDDLAVAICNKLDDEVVLMKSRM